MLSLFFLLCGIFIQSVQSVQSSAFSDVSTKFKALVDSKLRTDPLPEPLTCDACVFIVGIAQEIAENKTTFAEVTALVEDMQLVAPAHRDSPEEWVPALCSTSFELADDESIPTDEAGFCSYLDRLDPQWELIDTSDYQLT